MLFKSESKSSLGWLVQYNLFIPLLHIQYFCAYTSMQRLVSFLICFTVILKDNKFKEFLLPQVVIVCVDIIKWLSLGFLLRFSSITNNDKYFKIFSLFSEYTVINKENNVEILCDIGHHICQWLLDNFFPDKEETLSKRNEVIQKSAKKTMGKTCKQWERYEEN